MATTTDTAIIAKAIQLIGSFGRKNSEFITGLAEMRAKGWEYATEMPAVGTVVWTDAHGAMRRGFVTEVGRTRCTVALTTASALELSRRHNQPINMVVRSVPFKHVMVQAVPAAEIKVDSINHSMAAIVAEKTAPVEPTETVGARIRQVVRYSNSPVFYVTRSLVGEDGKILLSRLGRGEHTLYAFPDSLVIADAKQVERYMTARHITDLD